MMIGSAWFLREWELPTLQVTVSRILGAPRVNQVAGCFASRMGSVCRCFTRPEGGSG